MNLEQITGKNKNHRLTTVSTCLIRPRSKLTRPTQISSRLREHTEMNDFTEIRSHGSKVHQGRIHNLWQGMQ